jgi:hypothetical protein
VPVIEIHGQHRAAPQVGQGWCGAGGEAPGGVQVPASAGRVEGDVVADGAGGGLGLVLGGSGGVQVRAGAEQSPPAAGDRYLAAGDPLPGRGVPGREDLQPGLLAVAVGRGGVPADPARGLAGRDGEPGLDGPDPGRQGGPFGMQVPPGELPLVLGGAGDRPGLS